MDIASWLLLILAFFLLSSAVAVVLLVVTAQRLALRAGRGWLALQANFMVPGPRRDVIGLRVQLGKEVRGAKMSLRALDATHSPRGDLSMLVRRLERLAKELDAELGLLQAEPDEEMLHGFLPSARGHVRELVSVSRSVRQVAVAVLSGETEDTIRGLAADAGQEVRALQAGVDTLLALKKPNLDHHRSRP